MKPILVIALFMCACETEDMTEQYSRGIRVKPNLSPAEIPVKAKYTPVDMKPHDMRPIVRNDMKVLPDFSGMDMELKTRNDMKATPDMAETNTTDLSQVDVASSSRVPDMIIVPDMTDSPDSDNNYARDDGYVTDLALTPDFRPVIVVNVTDLAQSLDLMPDVDSMPDMYTPDLKLALDFAECPAGTLLYNGVCIVPALNPDYCVNVRGLSFCEGMCRNSDNDTRYCGGKGVDCVGALACATGVSCVAGACAVPDMLVPPDMTAQPDLVTVSDMTNLPDLTNTPDLTIPPDMTSIPCDPYGECPSGMICYLNQCIIAARNPDYCVNIRHLAFCDGICTNGATDYRHCGAHGTDCSGAVACPVGVFCHAGICDN